MNGIKAVVLAIAVALFLKLLVFDFTIAQGHSMEPAIQDGAVLVINRLRYGVRLQDKYLLRWAKPKEGEVVVFYTPAGEMAVKRCKFLSDDKENFYAEGDNGSASYDSRSYGEVPLDSIFGKVLGK